MGPGKKLTHVNAEGHGGNRDRRGESDRPRNPAGEKAERWMIDFAQEIVFTAGTRQGRAEFRIGKRAAHRAEAADHSKA